MFIYREDLTVHNFMLKPSMFINISFIFSQNITEKIMLITINIFIFIHDIISM